MVSEYDSVLREQVLDSSKLDFLVGNTYIEVKTPLQSVQVPYLNILKQRELENSVLRTA